MVDSLSIVDANGPQSVQTIDWLARQGLPPGESHVGQIGGHTPRVIGSMTRLDEASAGAYAAGDLIANSTTAANVNPLIFDMSRVGASIVSGRITGCRCIIEPASGNLITTNLDFDLLLFRSSPNIPYGDNLYPADNAPLNVSATMFRDLVAIFTFANNNWRNGAGGLTGGAVGYQALALTTTRFLASYNLADIASATTILGLVQAKAAWTPGNIDHRFDFYLDVDAD